MYLMKQLHCEPEEYWMHGDKNVKFHCRLHRNSLFIWYLSSWLLLIFLSASSNCPKLDLYLCFHSLSPSIHSSGGNLKAKQTKKEQKEQSNIGNWETIGRVIYLTLFVQVKPCLASYMKVPTYLLLAKMNKLSEFFEL